MPPYYIGGGNPIGAMFRPSGTGPEKNPINPEPRPNPTLPGKPITTTHPQPPGNILGADAVRATGPSHGYDPSYLQNLATAIGGLFSNRSGHAMNINPLGNLNEISPSSGMEGNAPLPGLPSTWLQDALNGMGFNFAPKAATAPQRPPGIGGFEGGGGGRGGGRRINLLQ